MASRRALSVVLLLTASCGTKAPVASSVPRASRTPTPTATLAPTPSPTKKPTAAPETQAPASGAACRYVFPVRPPSATNYGASHHDYPATDIFAPKGSPVVSPVDGVIDYVSRTDTWDPKVNDGATRGGLSFAVIGRDGIRYYGSHLLDVTGGIAPGEHVAAGQLVGHVDSSGDARGISPHLHFGISHPTTPTDWKVRRGEVSPYRYLNDWRADRMTTPDVPGARTASCT